MKQQQQLKASSTQLPEVSPPKRMSITLSSDAAKWLEFLADTQGITQTEALRKAIATEAYIQKEILEGSKILVQKADKEIREVVFR
jgi:predicted transcriptional regulator